MGAELQRAINADPAPGDVVVDLTSCTIIDSLGLPPAASRRVCALIASSFF